MPAGKPNLDPQGLSIAALREILDGVLLGDGGLDIGHNSKNARLRLGQTARGNGRDWILNIQSKLERVGIYGTVREYLYEGDHRWWLQTLSYPCLRREYERWYPQGPKIVPPDVLITPVTIADWFAGDGCGRPGAVRFHTNGFALPDVQFLCATLHQMYGWRTTLHFSSGPIINLRTESWYSFYALIKPYLHPAFHYKLRFIEARQERERRKAANRDIIAALTDTSRIELFDQEAMRRIMYALRVNGPLTTQALAADTKYPVELIANICPQLYDAEIGIVDFDEWGRWRAV